MLGCVRACTCGWAWIGMSHAQQAHSSCRSGGTSALELRNSFESIFEIERRNMSKKQLALLLLFVSPLLPQTQAEIKHVEMLVEGMT
jgi:hypothetical protein